MIGIITGAFKFVTDAVQGAVAKADAKGNAAGVARRAAREQSALIDVTKDLDVERSVYNKKMAIRAVIVVALVALAIYVILIKKQHVTTS